MPAFFKALFGSKKQTVLAKGKGTQFSDAALKGSSLAEIVEVLKARPTEQLTFQEITALIRRFYRIAWFDNRVAQQDRESAAHLADALPKTLNERSVETPKLLRR